MFDHLSSEISALIPKKALAELHRLLSEAGEEDAVSFGKDETHLFFSTGQTFAGVPDGDGAVPQL